MFGIILRLCKAGYWTYKQVKVGSQAWKAAARGSKFKGDDLGKLVDKAKKLKNNRNKKLKKPGTTTKPAAPSQATKPSWINAAGEFTPLGSKAIGKLTAKTLESYKKARTAHKKLKKAQRIVANRKVVDARKTLLGKGLGRVQNVPGYLSRSGSRLGGTGRAAYLLGTGYGLGEGAMQGVKYLLSDKDADADEDASATATATANKGTTNRKSMKQAGGPPQRQPITTVADKKKKEVPSKPLSTKAGVAWGKKRGIDVSYDFPGMSPVEYKKGLKEGTISKKLGMTKEGKLTKQAEEELEEKQYRRHGGSVSADNYKLRKKSSKKGSASKKSSWNY